MASFFKIQFITLPTVVASGYVSGVFGLLFSVRCCPPKGPSSAGRWARESSSGQPATQKQVLVFLLLNLSAENSHHVQRSEAKHKNRIFKTNKPRSLYMPVETQFKTSTMHTRNRDRLPCQRQSVTAASLFMRCLLRVQLQDKIPMPSLRPDHSNNTGSQAVLSKRVLPTARGAQPALQCLEGAAGKH